MIMSRSRSLTRLTSRSRSLTCRSRSRSRSRSFGKAVRERGNGSVWLRRQPSQRLCATSPTSDTIERR